MSTDFLQCQTHRPIAQTAFMVCCLIGLLGYSVTGFAWKPWENTNYTGPLLEGDQRAVVVWRCAIIPDFMSRGPCQVAFIDHHGKKVLWTEIQDEVDGYLPNVPPIVPWVGSPHNFGNDAPNHNHARMPYVLHVLTISPVVVLVVPRHGDEEIRCGKPYDEGCMPSSRMAAIPYWYSRNPKIGAGSFWFAPSLSRRITYLPEDARAYTIELPDSSVELIAKDNVWNVQRNKIDK